MSIMSRPVSKKPDPAARYVVIEGFVSKFGTYATGAVVGGDDPAVAAMPHLFVTSGATDGDRSAAHAALLRSALPADETPYVPRTGDGTPVRIAKQLTADEAVVAIEAIFPYGRQQLHMGYIAAGTVVGKHEEVAKRWPKSFRPATAADIPA